LPDGEIVLVYGVAPIDSDVVVTTKPESTGVPTKMVPLLPPDGCNVRVYPVALAGSKEVARWKLEGLEPPTTPEPGLTSDDSAAPGV